MCSNTFCIFIRIFNFVIREALKQTFTRSHRSLSVETDPFVVVDGARFFPFFFQGRDRLAISRLFLFSQIRTIINRNLFHEVF